MRAPESIESLLCAFNARNVYAIVDASQCYGNAWRRVCARCRDWAIVGLHRGVFALTQAHYDALADLVGPSSGCRVYDRAEYARQCHGSHVLRTGR